jgi:GT2 family glycosyltransferase
MVRRSIFEQVKGLDEAFPVNYGDVDFSLRVREAGYRIVYTPYAELYHDESASRVSRLDPGDIGLLQQHWGEKLRSDPFYNPNLSLQRSYRLNEYNP